MALYRDEAVVLRTAKLGEADRIIVLCGGTVVADGTRDEVFSRADLAERVGIRPPEIFTMAKALEPQALCYTIDEFTDCFREER